MARMGRKRIIHTLLVGIVKWCGCCWEFLKKLHVLHASTQKLHYEAFFPEKQRFTFTQKPIHKCSHQL